MRAIAREHEREFRRELPFLRALEEHDTAFALATCSDADGRPPLRPFTWSRVCTLLVEGERWRDALGLADAAVRQYPGAAWPHLARAEAFLSGRDRQAAREAWQRASDLEGTTPEVLRMRALLGPLPPRTSARAGPRDGDECAPCTLGLPSSPRTIGRRWPGFRGPDGAGLSPCRGMPHEVGDASVLWRAALPGPGHASPVVWDGVVFLSCVDGERDEAESRVLVALDLADGSERWRWTAPFTRFKKNPKNSFASATPAVDDDHVYLVAADGDRLTARAFSHAGDLVWERSFEHYWAMHGHGSSPLLAGELLIVTNDHEGAENLVAGLDRRTGATRWLRELAFDRAGFSTPLLYCGGDDRLQVVLANANTGLASFDAATGESLWELGEERPVSVASPIRIGDAVLAAFAGQRAELYAPGDAARGTAPRVLRRFRRGLPSVPTPLALGDVLFLWSDGGIVSRVDASTGAVSWSERVGGSWYASPVFADGHLYSASEEGELVVVSASKHFRVCGRFMLGAPVFATPAIAEGTLLVRTGRELVAFREGTQ